MELNPGVLAHWFVDEVCVWVQSLNRFSEQRRKEIVNQDRMVNAKELIWCALVLASRVCLVFLTRFVLGIHFDSLQRAHAVKCNRVMHIEFNVWHSSKSERARTRRTIGIDLWLLTEWHYVTQLQQQQVKIMKRRKKVIADDVQKNLVNVSETDFRRLRCTGSCWEIKRRESLALERKWGFVLFVFNFESQFTHTQSHLMRNKKWF